VQKVESGQYNRLIRWPFGKKVPSQQAPTETLKVLKDAGVLDSEKVGQEVYYWLERERIVATLRALADATAAFRCGA